jgi:hypothetical protein
VTEKAPVMTACEAMTVAAGGEEDHREPTPPGDEQEERAADGGRIAQDQCTLTQVTEDAGGEDQDQPDPGDRRAAEVSHVRVQRLGSGDGEHHRGQREERGREMPGQEAEGVGRGQRLEDRRVGRDAAHPDDADRGEPDAHDRPEQAAHGTGAQSLQKKQDDDDRRRDRHDQAGQ